MHSDSYTVGDIELIVHGKLVGSVEYGTDLTPYFLFFPRTPGGAQIRGTTVASLVTRDNGYHSRASFRGLSLSPGNYIISVNYWYTLSKLLTCC